MSASQPDQNHLHGDELGKMISLHLDSKITEEQFVQLQYTLEVDESARDFYIEFMSTHARLEQSLKHTFSLKNQSQLSDKDLLNELLLATSRPSKRFYLTLLGLPVALLIVIGVLILNRVPPSYVTVTDAHQARIGQNEQLSIGNSLKSHAPYRLESGHLELLFVTGTKVLITAPATFEIMGKNELSISEGKLVAKVTTPAGKGFTVQTPEGAVVDLGTLFGVEIEKSGESGVQVFKGDVELNDFSGGKTVLPAGKTMRSAAGQKQWRTAKKLSPEFYTAIQEKKQTILPDMVFINDARHSMFGIDDYLGIRYLMYSAIPLKVRFTDPESKKQHWDGVAKHFAVVHFDETSQLWYVQGNEQAIRFEPDSTDLLLASIEETTAKNGPSKKNMTYFSEMYDTIHGIASGYQTSDIQVLPDWFEKIENDGDYTINGSYLIRKPD
ncbi:MAG: FecR family protein [Planctomycetota bacterium]